MTPCLSLYVAALLLLVASVSDGKFNPLFLSVSVLLFIVALLKHRYSRSK